MDVKTLCLGVLSTADRTGYEIKKTFEDSFKHFFRASYGSIYPALAELERTELIVGRAVEQGRRPEKRVYRITEAGREALRTVLAAEEPRHAVRSEFLVLIYFAHLVPPDRLAQVIDRMTVQFEQVMSADLERFDGSEGDLTPGQRFALGYGRTVLTAALDYLRGQRAEFLSEIEARRREGRPLPAGGLAAAGD
jgi:DNA-binding PadR family transcriptional regulator